MMFAVDVNMQFKGIRDGVACAEAANGMQRELFLRTMYSRPYGGDVLVGWKRAAFDRGLI